MPYLVAGVVRGKVRFIRDPRQPAALAVLLDFLPGAEYQRADYIPAHRRNSAQTLQTCAAHEVQEHRFGAVVGIVRRSQLLSIRDLRKKIVPHPARALLQAFVLLLHRSNVGLQNPELHAEPLTELLAEMHVSVGFRAAQMVINMTR